MANELVLTEQFQSAFPTMAEGLKKAQNLFSRVHTLEDVEREFLKGAGLSPNTYRSYLTSYKQFHDYSGGLNPLQVTPQWVEAFYDDLIKRGVDRNTAALRMSGLKRFFKSVEKVVPFYTSPFEIMGKKLKRKLSKTRKNAKTKTALTASELNRLLEMLAEDTSILGLSNYAIVLALVTTGLRVSEFLSLSWRDVEFDEEQNVFSVTFTAKGGNTERQEVPPLAIEALAAYHRAQFGGDPKPEARIMYCSESYPGKPLKPMSTAVLDYRLKDIYKQARAREVLRREMSFSAHLFRRTFATLLYKAGVGLRELQNATRHKSVEVLAKHYVDSTVATTPYWSEIIRGEEVPV